MNDNLLILIAVFTVLVPYGLFIFCHALPKAIVAEQKQKEETRSAFLPGSQRTSAPDFGLRTR